MSLEAGPSASQDRMDGRRSVSPEHEEHELSPVGTATTAADEKQRRDSRTTARGVTLANDIAPDGASNPAYPPGRPNHRQSTRETSFDIPPLRQRLTDLFVAERPIKEEPTVAASLRAILTASWLNVLLLLLPVGWALHFTHQDDTVVFVFTFLTIIPLAKLLGYGTEELALRVGQTLGGLLNATLGNAVELIVAILALAKCEIQVVQSSLLGSILSNLLLVLGMCFFAGGIKFSEQGFKDTAAQLNSSLLVISVIAVLLPAGYNAAFSSNLEPEVERDRILKMSRGTSIILLVVYLAYLAFQLFTHQHLYAEGNPDPNNETLREGRPVWGLKEHRAFKPAKSVRLQRRLEEGIDEEDEEEAEEPTLNKWVALGMLVVVTVLVALTAEFLVSSINGLTDAHPEISVEWVGLILLPIVGNAAEHVTAVTVSVHDKIDLSMGVAIGSSIQIALFVIPFMVTLGWMMDKACFLDLPLSLLFDPFESITLFLSVLLVNYTVQDVEGFLLMAVYIIIAVAFWFYPDAANTSYTC
ncbi:hypothetical protein JCM10213v2_005778 [Rhodosporidiobolus nylandii]